MECKTTHIKTTSSLVQYLYYIREVLHVDVHRLCTLDLSIWPDQGFNQSLHADVLHADVQLLAQDYQ